MTDFETLVANPWGPFTPAVADLNLRLRSGPIKGKFVLLALDDGRFELGQLPGHWPGKIERLGITYETVLDGERDILTCRHNQLTLEGRL
jgi:hypothetical protein